MTLSSVVQEIEDGVLVLRSGTRVRFSPQVRPENLAPGSRVTIKARLREGELIADDIQVDDD